MSFETVLEIQGGRQLNGTVHISGAKNAILPLMAATVLTDKPVTFSNVPKISDVDAMRRLLLSHKVSVDVDPKNDKIITCTATDDIIPKPENPYISSELKASNLLLGPLLARLGRARLYRSGGDDIDSKGRPIDIHKANLTAMGAIVKEVKTEDPTYIEASAPNGNTANSETAVHSTCHMFLSNREISYYTSVWFAPMKIQRQTITIELFFAF